MSQASFTLPGHNPDVLTCIANLSNDEVFTPPELANQMLDTLESSWADSNGGGNIWANKEVTFLDPCTKSGVFLREIVKRLNKGLSSQIPDLTERVNHILTKQVFGIGITQLTSLLARRSVYCSKYANGIHSVARTFATDSGNIWFNRTEHTWLSGKCKFCGASKAEYGRSIALETHAYAFIHNNEIGQWISQTFGAKVHFDVIIGNPPYQLDTGGSGRQAKPIYQHFVSQAKALEPRFLSMVMPARWYSGGFGLDQFRSEMLSDRRICNLVDFENASDVFPGVDIAGGICYFLWNREYEGDCEVTNKSREKSVSSHRKLNEFEIFIRQSNAIPIIRKIREQYEGKGLSLNEVVSSIRPFGLPTNYEPRKNGIPCVFTQKIGIQFASPADVTDTFKLLDKWKVLIPKAPIAGQTDFSKPIRIYHDKNVLIARPGECCTESWIVANSFRTKKEAESFKTYLFTKIVRFLILQTVISQDINRKNFRFVPDLVDYVGSFDDELLRKKWRVSDEEWSYIDSRILETS